MGTDNFFIWREALAKLHEEVNKCGDSANGDDS